MRKPKGSYKLKLIATLCITAVITIVIHKPLQEYKWAHKWGKSVVRLLGSGGGGTGFQMEWEGQEFILTNDHVCELHNANNQLLVDSPWGEIRMSSILFRSKHTDLCILEPHPQLEGLHLGNSDFLPHEGILVLGHPKLDKLTPSYGSAKHKETIQVNMGTITTPEEEAACHLPKNKIEEVFFGLIKICTIRVAAQMTTAIIYPGNSGSPVLDRAGYVRGVAFAAGGDNLAAILPWHSIKEFLDESYKPASVPEVHCNPK